MSETQAPKNTQASNILTRFMSSSEAEVDQETRSITFPFSSTRPVERYAFYTDDLPEGTSNCFDEILSHDPAHWNLERVTEGVCPYLQNHDRGKKLGMVKTVEFDGDRALAKVRLVKNAAASDHLSDVLDGLGGGVSFGYAVQKYRVLQPAIYEGEGYERRLIKKAVLQGEKIVLYEVSNENCPADPSVGYGKSAIDLRTIQIEGDPHWERATPGELKKSDFVGWNSSGGTSKGRIETVATSGSVQAVPTGPSMDGTPEQPAYLVNVWQEETDGWKASDVKVVKRASSLTEIASLKKSAIGGQSFKAMGTDLGSADAEFDLRFLDAMIPHHEGAVVMANDALDKSKRPEIQKLAGNIVSSQEADIESMKAWKKNWYPNAKAMTIPCSGQRSEIGNQQTATRNQAKSKEKPVGKRSTKTKPETQTRELTLADYLTVSSPALSDVVTGLEDTLAAIDAAASSDSTIDTTMLYQNAIDDMTDQLYTLYAVPDPDATEDATETETPMATGVKTMENVQPTEQETDRDRQFKAMQDKVQLMERRELVTRKFTTLRQKAEALKSAGKLTPAEFNDKFSDIDGAIDLYTKAADSRIDGLEERLSDIDKYTPAVEFGSRLKNEPLEVPETRSEYDAELEAYRMSKGKP